jgi:Lipid A 3-O-deacylase (PagL)
MIPRARALRAVVLFFGFAAAASGQSGGPLGRSTLTVAGIGGPDFLSPPDVSTQVVMPMVEAGRFVFSRLEVGLALAPGVFIRQSIRADGLGERETATAFAAGVYVRLYPAPYSWRIRPYLEISEEPFYADRPVPAGGSRFNFLSQGGAGFSTALSWLEPWSLIVGYRFVHVSNAQLYHPNPGATFNGIVLGLRKYTAAGGAR